jgi:hypothetical protein
MKKLILALIMLVVLSMPTMAEDLGIHGETSFKYELAEFNPGQAWTIDLHYNFTDWFTIGASETTFTNGYDTLFNAVPAFIPNGQLYEFYIQLNVLDNVSVKLSQWCNHPVYSYYLNRTTIPGGFYVEGKYKF